MRRLRKFRDRFTQAHERQSGQRVGELSQPNTKIQVLRIPTDEELEIALQTKKVLEKTE
ncbi:hypothetical protein HpEKA22_14390 [Helicobacter pylori]